jgi:hypothetical protein
MIAAGEGGWKLARITASAVQSAVKTSHITHKEMDRIIAPFREWRFWRDENSNFDRVSCAAAIHEFPEKPSQKSQQN